MCSSDLSTAAAWALSAQEVMTQYDQQMRAASEQVKITMRLINPQGKVRVRDVNYLSKTNPDGKQNTVLRFTEPADVRGTALLTLEHKKKEDDDRWLYLPALRKVRRVAATEDSDNFMGSDFAYEDMDFEKLDSNSYRLLRTETVQGADCYVIEATPTDKAQDKTGYSKRLLWIRKDNAFMVYAEYYDKKGELLKKRTAYDLAQADGSGKWRPKRQEMQNIKTGHKTEIVYDGYRIGKEIADREFSQQALANNS